MISICEKVGSQQLRKAKNSILASISHIFQKFFFTEPHTHFYNTLCKSHDFLISCFESGHIFKKCAFWKNSCCHSFLNKNIYTKNFSGWTNRDHVFTQFLISIKTPFN